MDPKERELAGPLHTVRHNLELIDNKMLRNIQNHLAETKYKIPSILQEIGHDKDYQLAYKRRNQQVFDEETYNKIAEDQTKATMDAVTLEEIT